MSTRIAESGSGPRPSRVAALVGRLPRPVREPLRRWWRSMLSLLPTAARLPAVSIGLARWLPCWALRVATALVAVGSAALVVRGGLGWTVTAVLAVVILLWPNTPAAVLLGCVLGFSMLQDPARVWGVRESLLLLGTHACVALCLLIGTTSSTAKVQFSALLPPGLRFAVIQLSAQLLALLGALVAGRELSGPWIPVAAAMTILLTLLLWLPRLRAHEEHPGVGFAPR